MKPSIWFEIFLMIFMEIIFLGLILQIYIPVNTTCNTEFSDILFRGSTEFSVAAIGIAEEICDINAESLYMISKKFLTSSLIYSISSALSTVASFILLPFYTDTALLTIGDYGALSLYIGLSLLVQVFTSMNMEYYVIVEYAELKDRPEYLKSKIASLSSYMIIAGTVIALIFLLGVTISFKIILTILNHPLSGM
jgi:hypothetical protein